MQGRSSTTSTPAVRAEPGAASGVVSQPDRPKLLVVGAIGRLADAGLPDDLHVATVDWSLSSASVLSRSGIDLVVPVVEAFDESSAAFFNLLAKTGTHAPVLAVLPAGDVRSSQFALAAGASDDFVVMPVRAEEWRERVARLTGPRSPESEVSDNLAHVMGLLQLVGRAPSFLDVVRKVPLIARSGSPAFITGETGTGKELCARAIHFTSPRRNQPFIPVDCGAIPDNLFENELFGHVRGAFTDAHKDQRGLVGLADGGTLFLDEIDSLSMAAQAKLLRFLQDRSYRPLGSDRFLRANVNVLAAMNASPEGLVRDRRFRADLFFRLNVVRLHLSPLRERLTDVPLLARHFVASYAAECGLGAKALSPSVLPKLLAHDWPGNVRELGNVLQRAVVLAPGRHILAEHVILAELNGIAEQPNPADDEDGAVSFRKGRAQVIEAFERTYVARLIQKHAGNVTRAAREAQQDRRAFGRLLKKHGLRSGLAAE